MWHKSLVHILYSCLLCLPLVNKIVKTLPAAPQGHGCYYTPCDWNGFSWQSDWCCHTLTSRAENGNQIPWEWDDYDCPKQNVSNFNLQFLIGKSMYIQQQFVLPQCSPTIICFHFVVMGQCGCLCDEFTSGVLSVLQMINTYLTL